MTEIKKYLILILLILSAACVSTRSDTSSSLIDNDYVCPDCNLILISIDTLRADHLGVYGYERNTSPNIDLFAMENLIFDNHIATMATTLPTHTSMFTGMYPKNHGILENGIVLNDSLITLAEILKEEGYKTAGIVSSMPLHSNHNIHQGFDEYQDVTGLNYFIPKESRNATFATKRAISWLDNNERDRFFLFLHYFDPHDPYDPPAEYNLWGEDRLSRYDGEIRYTDDNLKKLFDFLNENSFLNNTIIILTADHGESLGERGYWLHGKPIYENTAHVPLIIHLPGLNKKMKIETQTSQVDLLPTILDILGIRRSLDYDGISFLSNNITKREYVFIQRRDYPGQGKPVRPLIDSENFEFGDKFAVRSNEWKYIYRTLYEDELYNLSVDPNEEQNLINKSVKVAQKLKGMVLNWLNESREINTPAKEVDEETKDQLKQLGYMT